LFLARIYPRQSQYLFTSGTFPVYGYLQQLSVWPIQASFSPLNTWPLQVSIRGLLCQEYKRSLVSTKCYRKLVWFRSWGFVEIDVDNTIVVTVIVKKIHIHSHHNKENIEGDKIRKPSSTYSTLHNINVCTSD
jgi:hypothetical protein